MGCQRHRRAAGAHFILHPKRRRAEGFLPPCSPAQGNRSVDAASRLHRGAQLFPDRDASSARTRSITMAAWPGFMQVGPNTTMPSRIRAWLAWTDGSPSCRRLTRSRAEKPASSCTASSTTGHRAFFLSTSATVAPCTPLRPSAISWQIASQRPCLSSEFSSRKRLSAVSRPTISSLPHFATRPMPLAGSPTNLCLSKRLAGGRHCSK